MGRRVESGYDFGVRERIRAVVDPTFAELLGAREAVAYGQEHSFELLAKSPTVYFVFADERSARSCFRIFADWIRNSNDDGDAVDITFIEYATGSYGVVTGPELRRLIKRTLPVDLNDEYEQQVVAPSRMIEIPQQSEAYRWFRMAVQNRPFVVAPATHERGPIMELAFRKREVAFYRESEVPEDHPAFAYARRRHGPRKIRSRPTMPEGQEVHVRRERQLRRFFPVTLERLRFNSQFNRILAILQDRGSDPWEVRQAICNLTLRHRYPDLFATLQKRSETSRESVLSLLLEKPETVDDGPLPNEYLTIESVDAQQRADRRYLLEAISGVDKVSSLPDKRICKELKRLGMIRT